MLGFLLQLLGILFSWHRIQVPPNKAAVITSRRTTRIFREGTTWVKPPYERFQGYIPLDQIQLSLPAQAYTKLYVPVKVDAVALIKVKGENEAINRAAERYLSKTEEETSDKIQKQVGEILVGHLRAILATLTVQEINSDRQALATRTSQEAATDLDLMGIGIDALTIQHVQDEHKHIPDTELGYMDALGQQTVSEVRREAIIQIARNEREAEVFKAQQQVEIANAQRDRDIQIAKNDANVAEFNAQRDQAGPKADAIARQGVVEEEVKIEQRRKAAETIVQENEIERKKKELQATVVLPAEAEKEATIRRTEGELQSRINRAEAGKVEREQEGSGEGRRIREVGEAEALVIQKKAEGAAAGERARLLAQAEGQEKLVQALNSYNTSAIQLAIAREIIERLPQIVEASSKPLGEIDRIVMIDAGSGDGSGPISRFMGTVPIQIARTLEMLKETTGIDVVAMLQNKTGEQQDGKGE
jgi:flotillin